jgi:hypothetical protein
LISNYPPLLAPFMTLLDKALDFCNETDVPYLFFAERPLFSVTLRAGERSQVISVGRMYAGITHGRTPREDLRYCDCEVLLDRAYVLPLGDRSWPDDTLVEFEYMDQAPPLAVKPVPEDDATDAVLIGKSTKADVLTALGGATGVRFDSGFEVWAYEFGPQKRPLGKSEFVVLFDPAGVVTKTRLRPAPPASPAKTS